MRAALAESRADTRNLTEFLLRWDEPEVARLTALYPGQGEQALFSKKEVMKSLSPLDKARVELALSALDAFIGMWASKAPALSATLNRASIWKFWGAVLAAVGGGSSMTLLLGKPDQTLLAAATSAIALAGGLIGLTAKFLRRDVYGNDDALTDKYRQLSKGAAQATGLVRTLRPFASVDDDGGDRKAIEAALTGANKLIADMDELLQSLAPE
jgi:hypothetical protein